MGKLSVRPPTSNLRGGPAAGLRGVVGIKEGRECELGVTTGSEES